MKKLLLLLMTTLSLAQTPAITVTYQSSNETIWNPERGLSKYSKTVHTNYSPLSLTTLNGYKNSADKISIIYRAFYIPTTPITSTYLTNMQTDFNTLRAAGMKAMVRFAYEDTSSCTYCQASKAEILGHITQLAPILNANKDVIYSIQMGFIGGYGEWYYTNSTEFGDRSTISAAQWQNRKDICDAVLNQIQNIPIQLRVPGAKTKMYGASYKDRLGFYNDAFLNVWGDMGFFPISQFATPTSAQIAEVVLQTTKQPMSGESNGVNLPRTSGSNALVELDLYNYSVLNKDYHTDVINGWIMDGTYNEIINRLGYRFELVSSTWSVNGDFLSYRFEIKNTGYTNTLNNKRVFAYFNNTPIEIPVYTSEWSGTFIIIGEVFTSMLPAGTYNMFLGIEGIQLANIGTWQAPLNKLNYVFTKGDQVVPPIVVTPTPTPIVLTYTVWTRKGKYVGTTTNGLTGTYVIKYSDGKIVTVKL